MRPHGTAPPSWEPELAECPRSIPIVELRGRARSRSVHGLSPGRAQRWRQPPRARFHAALSWPCLQNVGHEQREKCGSSRYVRNLDVLVSRVRSSTNAAEPVERGHADCGSEVSVGRAAHGTLGEVIDACGRCEPGGTRK